MVFFAVFLVSIVLSWGIGAAWAKEARQPGISVLGSGKALSVLITSGQARLLLATGDDPVAFTNALAQARRPTTPRIDILLVAGRGRSLLVPIAARDMIRPRFVASLGPIPPSPERDALQAPTVPILPSPRRIDLGGEVQVDVETQHADGADADTAAWRIVVRHRATIVTILSSSTDAAAFPDIGPVAAVVIAGGTSVVGSEGIPAHALVVPAAAASGKDVRRDLGRLIREQVWLLRPFPGEAAHLDFVSGGLRLPASARLIDPSPSSPEG